MPEHGGRTAIVAAEVFERRGTGGVLEHSFLVGHVDRVAPGTVEAARDRAAGAMTAVLKEKPCCIVDVSTPQGTALWRSLRGAWPKSAHGPHPYGGPGYTRAVLFASFLQAYASGKVRFRDGLAYRADLDRALVFYMGQGVKKEGVELSSEDEAMVVALGLALYWPRHGAAAVVG